MPPTATVEIQYLQYFHISKEVYRIVKVLTTNKPTDYGTK